MSDNNYSRLLADITLSGTARAVGLTLATYSEPVTIDTITRAAAPGLSRPMVTAALNDLAAAGYLLHAGDRYQINPDLPGFPGGGEW